MLYKNRKHFSGLSFISEHGDKDYPQAPFTTVYLSSEIVNYYGDGAIWCSGLIELGLAAFKNNLWDACNYLLGMFVVDKAVIQLKNSYSGNNDIQPVAKEATCIAKQLTFKHRCEKFAKN